MCCHTTIFIICLFIKLLKTYKEALSRSDFPEDEVKIQKYLDLVSKVS